MKNIKEIEGEEEEDEEEELSEMEEEFNYEEIIKKHKYNGQNISSYLRSIKRKPIKRELYSNLLLKMYNITNKLQGKINLPEKYTLTIYNDILKKYLNELENKIIIMKNGYIETLVKKHFEKDENKKMEIILKANMPKKRNDVKKVYKQMISLIKSKKNELGIQGQKYYYLSIIEILRKYKVINEDEIKKFIRKFQKRRYNKKMGNGNTGVKEIKDDSNNYDDYVWINQSKSKYSKIFKFFTVALPLAYIINYVYANSKAII